MAPAARTFPDDSSGAVRFEVAEGVGVAMIETTEVNLFTVELVRDLSLLVDHVEADPDVRVVVFRSAHP